MPKKPLSEEKQNTPQGQKKNQISPDPTGKPDSEAENSPVHTKSPRVTLSAHLRAGENWA